VRVVELVLDARAGSLEPNGLYERVVAAPTSLALTRRLQGVPASLLIDAHGTVRHAIYGAEPRNLQSAVEHFLAR